MGQCLLLGWTEAQFWFSSYRAVWNMLRARQREQEHAVRRSWEQTRMICAHVIAPYRKKGTGTKPVFELPWDTEQETAAIIEQTPEQIAEREARFARWDARRKKKLADAEK